MDAREAEGLGAGEVEIPAVVAAGGDFGAGKGVVGGLNPRILFNRK